MDTAVVCSGRNRPQSWQGVGGGDAEGTPLVGGGDEPEEQLGAGVVQGCEADLVDEDDVVGQEPLDDPPDGVVGQAAVERLDEVGRGQVLHPVPGEDGRVTERDEGVRLARPCRADEGHVLLGPHRSRSTRFLGARKRHRDPDAALHAVKDTAGYLTV